MKKMMVLMVYFFILVIFSMSFFKSTQFKAVIMVEFLYMIAVVFCLFSSLLNLHLLVYIMMFSASESVVGLTMVMVLSKFFSFSSNLHVGYF